MEKEKFPAQFVENQLCWEFYLFRIEIERENAYFLLLLCLVIGLEVAFLLTVFAAAVFGAVVVAVVVAVAASFFSSTTGEAAYEVVEADYFFSSKAGEVAVEGEDAAS